MMIKDWVESHDTDSDKAPSSGASESFIEPGKMKVIYFSNEFPSDDTRDLFRRLRVHSKDKRHPTLARFIAEATAALRGEVAGLPSSLRATVPKFDSIFSLEEQTALRQGPLGGAIDGVLLCALQIATLIGNAPPSHYENGTQESFNPSAVDTCLTGLGTGLLSTVALSLSPNLADLPTTGALVVTIAFRLGVLVDSVSQNLQPRLAKTDSGPGDSWAYVIPDVSPEDIQKELDTIHRDDKTPEPSKIFISALSRTSVTHLHSFEIHIEQIVSSNYMDVVDAKYTPHIKVLSTSTGRPYGALTAKACFSNIIEEILTKAIRWDAVVGGIIQRAKDSAAVDCEVQLFRNSLPSHELLAALGNELTQIKASTKDLVSWITKPELPPVGPSGTAQSKIAIVGMACRLPGGATDPEKFWEVLDKGLDVHQRIPADRFDVDTHYDPNGKRMNASWTQYGCFIDEPGLFDAPFFNMSPREALQTDPMQRLALVTAYEALEKAGVVPNRTAATDAHRIGTYYGQASDDYREVNTAQEISTYFITGGCRAFGPGRINYFFKFSGPSYSVDTACSSGLAAIQVACTSLWAGEVDTAVAGGVNVLTNCDAFAGLSNGHFLTKTPNACKTWDVNADGYCRADGIASFVLKRLEDAEADNDNILGVILGAGTNHSADAISITHPHAGAQAFLTSQVVRQAGIDPLDVSYIEMHGTGTQAGDAQEILSVTEVFAPLTRRRTSKQPLHIGSVKSNVGHGEAVSGPTALVKLMLMFQKEAIPPHVGIKTSINPGFPKDLDKRNLRIPYEKTPWPRVPGQKRIAVVNNFSAAGGNSTLLVEEPPVRDPVQETVPLPSHVVTVSAKSKVSLKGNLERMIAYLEANPDVSLANVGYSSTARRRHHNHRVTVVASDVGQLKKQLGTYLQSVDSHKPIPATGPPPVVFAFTGQGASRPSMNLELFQHCPTFRSELIYLDLLAQEQGFGSFLPVIDGSHEESYRHSPTATQVALVCVEIALAKYWESLGVKPDVVVGHSLGEYAALYVAGVLSASDAISMVGRRAALLEKKCEAGSYQMLAVRASMNEIEAALNDRPFEVSCVNGPRDTVLSGTREECTVLSEILQGAGYRCISLDIAFAFHSSQTDPILEEFEETSKSSVLFQPPNIPIISPLLGKVIFDEKTINSNYLCRATRECVQYVSAIEAAQRMSIIDETMAWIEIGPHPVSIQFVKSILPEMHVAVPSIRRGEDNMKTVAQSLALLHNAGVELDWNEFYRPFEKNLRLEDLPGYAWNDKTHWIQYNGDWALTKGNTFYDAEKATATTGPLIHRSSAIKTSTVQQIIEETFSETSSTVVMRSNLMEDDFKVAAYGHRMNDCGVVTSSIHADIAYTLCEYILKKLRPKAQHIGMNITNLEVLKGLVAQKNADKPQFIQVSATVQDINLGVAHLLWHNVSANGEVDEPFASADVLYGSASDWLNGWIPATHLVQGRIEALEQLAEKGIANRLSHNMAYLLFANNLVDYAQKYRGMQSVVMHDLEAFADITLTTEKGGVWTVPPYFIDSVAHLAGFVMNVSDAIDTKQNFCVTPGWGSMRFAKPLVAGQKYRSYVKMIPTADDPSVYLGDVYILQDDIIIGEVGAIKFRRYPRILLNRFFSAPGGDHESKQASSTTITQSLPSKPVVVATPAPTAVIAAPITPPPEPVAAIKPVAVVKPVAEVNPTVEVDSDSTAAKAMAIVATEGALELSDLPDDAVFANLGVDSLMSLVIAEKFRDQLGVTVNGSLFLEYPTVGDLKAWLMEYYS
ncbi:Acyl transferase/acyl hydrolase/lysophospholipase [Penicillium occitanis (nom. inval.)]|nr:Acyl transferase/acyl hydrolase/lysophospholipase [Penicillium occitanis (nom. inval.)]PCG96242.1 hypothetical protein PENOC_073700 [Penicillium occitanis (nom. inval.)]